MADESDGGTPPTKGSWRRRTGWLAIAMILGSAIGYFGLAIIRGRGFDTAIATTVVAAVVIGLMWLAIRKLDD